MTTGNISVTDRFFQAYDELRVLGKTGLNQFCTELDVDKRNFVKQAADHSRHILKPEWLTFIVTKYGISADWLLTGRGWMFGK